MVGCSWLAWLLTTRMPRFLIFAIPILSIAIAVAIEALKPKRLHHGVAISIVMCACVLNCGEIFINWRALGTWKVVLGGMNREEYLSHSHKMYPTPYYPAVDFINKTLPSNAKVLFFEESRGFYCEREFIAVTPFAVNPLVRMVEESSSPEELERKLKSENITHLLINRAEIMRRGSAATAFTKRGEELFAAFSARYLKLLFERKLGIDAHDVQWVQVYELG
jgi:hypothetical protein